MRAVILAGGKGRRLAPFTDLTPKPLLRLGDMPILELILRQLKSAGLVDITLAVGHQFECIQSIFQNGECLGMNIGYSVEHAPMGTAGPLAWISGLDDTFLVMNGDILTTLDYTSLLQFHRKNNAVATIASYVHNVTIDFGVMKTDHENRVTEYLEKPAFSHKLSMGVYIFEPCVLQYLTKGQPLDTPDFINLLMANGQKVVSYPFTGYWKDIGRKDAYTQAVQDFTAARSKFISI